MQRLALGFLVCFIVTACQASDDEGSSGAGDNGKPPPRSKITTPVSHQDPPGAGMPCACTGDAFVCARANRGFAITPVPLATTGKTPEEITRIGYGSYLVNATGDCGACHSSAAGFLAGGNPFFLDRAGHVVWSRNLTPDPVTGLQLDEAQFLESIRTGRDFHPDAQAMLAVMPWPFYRWASDGDLRAIYAYLRAVPAAANAVPVDAKAGLGLPPAIPFSGRYDEGDVTRDLPIDDGALAPNLARGLAIQPLAQPCDLGDADVFARGSYLANSLSTCGECHTQGLPGASPGRDYALHLVTTNYLTGGNVFGVPPPLQPVIHQTRTMAANLIGASEGFFFEPGTDYALFQQIIATASHADETPPRPLGFPMPAENFANLLDDDLRAVFGYVAHLPANTTSDFARQDYARWCMAAGDCRAAETCHEDLAVGNECVGAACRVDADCDACQTCDGGTCAAPLPTSACVAGAL